MWNYFSSYRHLHIYAKIMFVLLFIENTAKVQGRTWYVSPDGNGQDGQSWATAYKTISESVTSADSGDIVFIRYGTYIESIRIDIPITVVGSMEGMEVNYFYEPDEGNRYIELSKETIVSPNGMEAPAFMCGGNCRIENVVITGSNGAGVSVFHKAAPLFMNCRISGNSSATVGGGIAVTDASPEFINCTITGNSAGVGGGFYIRESSNVLLQNCEISGNAATSEGSYGGGILFAGASLVMDNCRVIGNTSESGMENDAEGGGLYTNGGDVLIKNSFFLGNHANFGYGGQIYVSGNKSFLAENCTIIGYERAISWRNDPPPFVNSILWGSSSMCVPHFDSTGDPDISYSCIQGGYPGEGNISDDPLFRDPAAGDYRLLPESPCIDTAGTSGPPDDLNGNPRPVDIAGIGREVTDTYDMGAYEFQLNELPTPTPTETPSDVDPGHTQLYR